MLKWLKRLFVKSKPPEEAPARPEGNFWDGLTNEDDSRINTHHPAFQVGRFLYEAQVLYAKAEKQPTIDSEEVILLCKRYCELVTAVGQLRAYYGILERDFDEYQERARRGVR